MSPGCRATVWLANRAVTASRSFIVGDLSRLRIRSGVKSDLSAPLAYLEDVRVDDRRIASVGLEDARLNHAEYVERWVFIYPALPRHG